MKCPRERAGGAWAPDGTTLLVVRGGNGGNLLEFPPGNVIFRSTGFVSDSRVSAAGDRVALLDHTRSGDTGGTVMVVGKDGKAEP